MWNGWIAKMLEDGLQIASSSLPVLTCLNVRSAPVLEPHDFRLVLKHFEGAL